MSDANSDTSAASTTEHPHFWTDSRGRKYVGEGGGAIVRVSKLTAVAEHGTEAVADSDVHHALYARDPHGDGQIRVNAPDYLIPLSRSEHAQLHNEGEWQEVDGISLLLPEDRIDENETEDNVGIDTSDEGTIDAVA